MDESELNYKLYLLLTLSFFDRHYVTHGLLLLEVHLFQSELDYLDDYLLINQLLSLQIFDSPYRDYKTLESRYFAPAQPQNETYFRMFFIKAASKRITLFL